MGLSFAQSGQGEIQIGLDDVRELALAHGFAKPGAPKDAPPAARADLDKFFASFDCKALSTFKKRFCAEELAPPVFGAKPVVKAAALPTGFKARRCAPRRGCCVRCVRGARGAVGGVRRRARVHPAARRCSRTLFRESPDPGVGSAPALTRAAPRRPPLPHADVRAGAAHRLHAGARRVVRDAQPQLGEGAEVAHRAAPRRRVHPAGRLVPYARRRPAGAPRHTRRHAHRLRHG
jgi:hypothetical protein